MKEKNKTLYEKFEYTCKNCKQVFYTKGLQEMSIGSNKLGVELKINLQQHFKTNSFKQTFDTPKGKVTLNIEDLSIIADCSNCKHSDSYLLSEINPI